MINRIATKLILFVFIVSIISYSSCFDTDNALTEKEINAVDSLYRLRKKELKGKLDTICDSVYNAQFTIMVDSIKEIRKKEILDLLKK